MTQNKLNILKISNLRYGNLYNINGESVKK